uniref:Ig-like domain-containing protein n=1 Tax=Apis cerana TaxID=7461 RepID=V9IBC6_APICE
MTTAREERNRLWIRMSPCLFADSLRHVAPVLPFLWILVILLNDGKYHMLSSGELMILNITREDAERTYRCRTHHRLTQETVVSSNVGRLQLTEIRSTMPPMITRRWFICPRG